MSDRLGNFKELELGMILKDMKEDKQIINFYVIVNKKRLRVDKCDETRTRF